MKTALKYIELKTGFGHTGPAWIGLVSFSKSNKTLYFDGKAFQSLEGNGIYGNYYDIESGDEYWISGVKKNQRDRHIYGGGMIQVERGIVEQYLKEVNQPFLNPKQYQLVDVDPILPLTRIHNLENALSSPDTDLTWSNHYNTPSALTLEELDDLLAHFQELAIHGHFLKGRKYARNQVKLYLQEKEKRTQKEKD